MQLDDFVQCKLNQSEVQNHLAGFRHNDGSALCRLPLIFFKELLRQTA